MYRKLIISFLFGILLIQVSTFAQSEAKPGEETSSRDKKELQRLSKLFVKKYSQTRDIQPLINSFFLRDFMSFRDQEHEYELLTIPGKYLTYGDLIRGYRAEMTFVYIGLLAGMLGDTSSKKTEDNPFSSILPPNIAEQLNAVDKESDFPGKGKSFERKEFLSQLKDIEQILTKARIYLRKKNYEGSSSYKKAFKKLEMSDWAGYIFKSETRHEGIKYNDGKGIMRFPPETKIYSVVTPLFLVIQFVKVKQNFKILAIQIYDN